MSSGSDVPRKDRARAAEINGKAARAYEKACLGGDAGACDWAAELFGGSRSVAKDPQRAKVMRDKSCQLDPATCAPGADEEP